MVLQQRSLLITKARRNILTLLLHQHNAVEAVVRHVVVVERAGVLRDCVELSAKSTPCAAVYRVAVRGADDVRSRDVHCVVDHVCCRVEQSDIAAIDHFAVGTDADQIGLVNVAESDTEGVDLDHEHQHFFRIWSTTTCLTQKLSGSTGSRMVMWPATPSSNPFLPKIRNAAAKRPFR